MTHLLFSQRRAMQTKAIFAIFAGTLLSACSDTSGILGTDVGRQMANLDAPDLLSTEERGTPELILRDAVFLQVNGQEKRRAITTLEDDGAVCSDTVCSWSFVHRETWFDTMGVRMPGPRRTSKRTWTVSFVSDRILSQSDILTDFEVESVR